MTAGWRSPAFPLAVGAAIAPTAAMLQSKAMAPLAVVCLLLSVLADRRARGSWPWPSGAALVAGLLLAGWGALSALWAVEPPRALLAAAQLGGLVLLAGAAVRAVAGPATAPCDRLLLGHCLFWGVLFGLAASTVDNLTGNALRMAVRGLDATRPGLEFGLKPAASVAALLVPLLWAAPLPRFARLLGLAAGALALAALTGESARLAGLAGPAVLLLASLAPTPARRVLALGFAALLLAAPLLAGQLIRPAIAARLPPSAVHRLLIWDFALARAAEHPWLGWGMEASRAIPGGQAPPSAATLDHLALQRPDQRGYFAAPGVQSLPLHPHNGALQLRLELGWPGLVLAAGFVALLALAIPAGIAAAGLGAMTAAAVTFLLSFGAWQPWWMATQALAVALAAGLDRRA
ncbi:O-antigen ligase family protein [Roseomonas sp. BN140053]|uniref:O-antigen ligase family protein n=1 Tax=Roseomonas sp. BN140053 TaxID=3391898 RepID=UPI0039E854D5